jgi:hypothetical protein
MDLAAIDHGNGGSVHKAVDERRVGVLENLLVRATELIGWLRLIVGFHCYNENFLDFLRARVTAKDGQEESGSVPKS